MFISELWYNLTEYVTTFCGFEWIKNNMAENIINNKTDNKTKKVLMIADMLIMPLTGGNNKRLYNLVNMMRENNCEVDFLFLYHNKKEDWQPTIDFFGQEHFLEFDNHKRTLGVFLKRKVRAILTILHLEGLMFKYFTVDEKISPDIDKCMKQLFEKRHYDIVWAEYEYLSKALLYVPDGVLKVVDTLNAFAFKREMYEAIGYKGYAYATTKKEEAKAINRADWCIAIQEDEEKFFNTIKEDHLKVCTIGENMPTTEPYVADSKIILFVGSHYVVNQEGVKHFIKNILPLVKKQVPDCSFKLVGAICKCIPDSDEYEKLGYVDDVDAAYREARLVVNPVHVGTGLNIKTIEAVSKAKPLVSHMVGVRGLNPEKPFAIASDDDKEYANAIALILNSDEKALELSTNAYNFMNSYMAKNLSSFINILNS